MCRNVFSKRNITWPLLLTLLVVFITSCAQADADASRSNSQHPVSTPTSQKISSTPVSQYSPTAPVPPPTLPAYLKGKTASLSWINGSDCQEGIAAYLSTADKDANAALIGTGWVHPLTGSLLSGANNCMPDSSSMDNVVQLVHSKGGMVYLTITMFTEGPGAWSFQQGAAYVAEATRNQSYIDAIVQEVVRANYDGVIMDLEGVDHDYPDIQQLFATFNQQVWAALRPLHKWYGIALVHKISDRDISYDYNGFANWSLLAHAADFIVIMALDQSRYSPGPLVSLPWLKQILAYTMRTMPTMLRHIIWELPLYGASWHRENGGWVFDGILTYQAAHTLAQQATPSQIAAAASAPQDFFNPHVVYTDASGVKHAVWYVTARGLYVTIVTFWEMLRQEPEFGNSGIQIALWWRTTQELPGFWPLLDGLWERK